MGVISECPLQGKMKTTRAAKCLVRLAGLVAEIKAPPDRGRVPAHGSMDPVHGRVPMHASLVSRRCFSLLLPEYPLERIRILWVFSKNSSSC